MSHHYAALRSPVKNDTTFLDPLHDSGAKHSIFSCICFLGCAEWNVDLKKIWFSRVLNTWDTKWLWILSLCAWCLDVLTSKLGRWSRNYNSVPTKYISKFIKRTWRGSELGFLPPGKKIIKISLSKRSKWISTTFCLSLPGVGVLSRPRRPFGHDKLSKDIG